MQLKKSVSILSMVLGLAACGGGGGGGGGGDDDVELSPAQQDYSMQLAAASGGLASLSGIVPLTGPMELDWDYVHAIFRSLDGPLGLEDQAVQTRVDVLADGRPLASFPRFGSTVLLSGGRMVELASSRLRPAEGARADGDDVVVSYLAKDGSNSGVGYRITSSTTVPLMGSMRKVPADLATWPMFAVLAGNPEMMSVDARFASGSAYVKTQLAREGNHIVVLDCDNDNVELSACHGLTHLDKISFESTVADNWEDPDWEDGMVAMLEGVRMWRQATPEPDYDTPTYHAYFEFEGAVYKARVQMHGTPLQTRLQDDTLVDHEIVFNKAAIDSLKAALKR